MPRLLRIDVSPRMEGSSSRTIANQFIDVWKRKYPDGEIINRDLAKITLPHLDADTTAAFVTPPEERDDVLQEAVTLSDQLVQEFLTADEILISSPMYNFGVPSTLKAYIDHIIRAGYTFSYHPQEGFSGLVKTKHAYLALSYGAAGYIDGQMAQIDFLKPYLEAVLTFIGIPHIETVYIEGAAFAPEAAEQTKALVPERIHSILGFIETTP